MGRGGLSSFGGGGLLFYVKGEARRGGDLFRYERGLGEFLGGCVCCIMHVGLDVLVPDLGGLNLSACSESTCAVVCVVR